MSTIRFEDLGAPIQKLLNELKGGYTDDDMALMEYVSVKDMAKIYNDLNAQKEAKKIWKELKAELKRRKEEMDNADGKLEEFNSKRREIEEKLTRQTEEDEEEERAREERRKKKAAKRERKRREAEEQAAREAQELLEAEAAEEEKQRRREERRKRQEELEKQAEEEAAEEARQEAQRRKQKKEEKRRLKAEAEALRQEQESLEEAMRMKQKKESQKQSLAKQWKDYTDQHPLEFGGDDDMTSEIQQVHVERKTTGPPKEFLKIRNVTIPSFEEREDACFYRIVVHLKNGKKQEVEKRYSQFSEMRDKLGSVLEVVDASFPGKTLFFMRVRGGAAAEKRRDELEVWMNNVIKKLESTRTYAGVQLDSKQQLRGDAARAEVEKQRMMHAASARQTLYDFCDVTM